MGRNEQRRGTEGKDRIKEVTEINKRKGIERGRIVEILKFRKRNRKGIERG